MKILFINDYATTRGGANLMTPRLCEELRRQGHEVRLFASSARLAAGLADYSCFGTTSRRRVLLEAFNPSAYRQLRRALAAFRPDVVRVRLFLTQLSPLILPLLKDVPSLYHVSIYKCVCPLGTKLLPDRSFCRERAGAVCYRGGCLPLMLQHELWRHCRRALDLIVTNSMTVRRQLKAEGVEAGAALWNGVPYREPRPPLAERRLRLLRERGLAEGMGRAGRERALAHFDIETCAANFVRLYRTLCRDRDGAGAARH